MGLDSEDKDVALSKSVAPILIKHSPTISNAGRISPKRLAPKSICLMPSIKSWTPPNLIRTVSICQAKGTGLQNTDVNLCVPKGLSIPVPTLEALKMSKPPLLRLNEAHLQEHHVAQVTGYKAPRLPKDKFSFSGSMKRKPRQTNTYIYCLYLFIIPIFISQFCFQS